MARSKMDARRRKRKEARRLERAHARGQSGRNYDFGHQLAMQSRAVVGAIPATVREESKTVYRRRAKHVGIPRDGE